MRRYLIIFIAVTIFLSTTGLGCKTSSEVASYKPVTLEYWGVFEETSAISKLTSPYTGRHPKIGIRYRKFREDEYKNKMLEAWALGQGPDLFMIPVTRLREFLKFIEPMPASMEAPVEFTQGTLKKETVTELRTYPGLTPRQVRDLYIDTVAQDVIIDEKIYGLPYSIDTLSVYYNRELLKNNNIALPARTWNELIDQAAIISKVNTDDKLVQSTVALGTTNNVPAAFDIISTLMMQVGIKLGDADGTTFQTNPETARAIQFYGSFSQPGVKNYSWNKDMTSGLDAFTAGTLAYFIGYPYHANVIRAANPRLDWDVIPLFKPADAQNTPTYANYWITVVAKPPQGASAETRKKSMVAWQFLSEATQARNVSAFLDNPTAPRTTALKELVAKQQSNPITGPFTDNLLNAQNWYHGYNYGLAEQYFLEMVDMVQAASASGLDPRQIIQAGASRIRQTYSPAS